MSLLWTVRLRRCATAGVLAALLVLTVTPGAARADFLSAPAEQYALLFEGAGSHTLQITNVTINGNVGVGNAGKATVSGPASIFGSINFSAANSGQFANNNASNVITGGVNYNVTSVGLGLNAANALSQTLNGISGTSIAITGSTTINAAAGATFNVNGQSVHVFNASHFTNSGGNTLTIHGSASDLVAINLGGLGNIQVHGGIVFTGGITADNVLFNVGGGNYSTLSGAAALDINNNGGQAGIARGIFLDPNGAVSVTHAVVLGRVFGGGTHDFQYVSGSSITAPPPPTGSGTVVGGGPPPPTGSGEVVGTPAPPTALLFGSGAVIMGLVSWLRRRPNSLVAWACR
jgi:hypothetical protein